MKKNIIVIAAFMVFLAVAADRGRADEQEGVSAAPSEVVAVEPEIEVLVLVLEDGTREFQEIRGASIRESKITNKGYLAIKEKAQKNIDAILEEIESLDDRSGEGERHKQIEQIKMEAVVERLSLMLEAAEKRGDDLLSGELAEEIIHIEKISRPAAGRVEGCQPEQPIPEERR